MWGEKHLHGLARYISQGLLDLRRMPVIANGIGRNALIALGEMPCKLGSTACAGDAAFAVDNDLG